jgi:hypothetical protein
MTRNEMDRTTEATIPVDVDEWDPELGREAWCDNELALDGPEEAGTEDETPMAEDNYQASAPADPDLWLYRDRTSAILRRYVRLAVEAGRLPALLGREFFRTRVTSYHTQTFEDTVIFVHDVERCLLLLNDADIELIAVMVMQQRAQHELERTMRCTRRTIVRCYGDALDKLSEIFLNREILSRIPKKNPVVPEACQGGQTNETRINS